MSFPRKPDGSLDLPRFQSLSGDEKKLAIQSLQDPEEKQILREFITQQMAERQRNADATIAVLESNIQEREARMQARESNIQAREAQNLACDATIAELTEQNKALLYIRQQHISNFEKNMSADLDQIQSAPVRRNPERKGCTIL